MCLHLRRVLRVGQLSFGVVSQPHIQPGPVNTYDLRLSSQLADQSQCTPLSCLSDSVQLQGMPEEPSTRFQLRVKAVTAAITAVTAVSLLLADWGPGNVFSPIRPALKRYFNSIYNIQPAQPPPPPQPSAAQRSPEDPPQLR